MSIRHQVESGAPFDAERDLPMNIVIERAGLRDATERGIATKRHCSTSRAQTLTRWVTCVQAALTEKGWLLPKLRRASVATTLDRDVCLSTRTAINSPPSRWKALGASERKAATRSTRWPQASSEERTDRPCRGRASASNAFSKSSR